MLASGHVQRYDEVERRKPCLSIIFNTKGLASLPFIKDWRVCTLVDFEMAWTLSRHRYLAWSHQIKPGGYLQEITVASQRPIRTLGLMMPLSDKGGKVK